MVAWESDTLIRLFSLSSLQIVTGHGLSCKWRLNLVFLFFKNLTVKLTSEYVKVTGTINFEHQPGYNFFCGLGNNSPPFLKTALLKYTPTVTSLNTINQFKNFCNYYSFFLESYYILGLYFLFFISTE